MKKNLRNKIRTFLQSEEGKTGVKAPLALAVASGSFLLTQVILSPSVSAEDDCDSDCKVCIVVCKEWDSDFSCIDLRSTCAVR